MSPSRGTKPAPAATSTCSSSSIVRFGTGFLLALSLAFPHAVAALPAVAPGGPVPETKKFRYSQYEQATIDGALAALGFAVDDHPDGKIVESIHTVRLEVIEDRDPAPRFLNVFHVVTRSYVVERELLLRPGEPFLATLADETQRNLAALPQLSLVLVVAAEGTQVDRVRIVVITKDVWSLRLNWNLGLSSAGLQSLSVNPAETNVLGTHQSAGLLLGWLPRSYSLGAQYAIPRVLGSHVAASADAGLIFNSTSGAREGSFGDLQIGQPLWSSRTEWSWNVAGSWLKEVTRRYTDGRVAAFALDRNTDCRQAPSFCVPDAYLTDVAIVDASLTRSFGWARKHDVTFGLQVRRNRYTLPDLSAFDPATVQAYDRSRVPVGDDRVGPYLMYRTYSSDFARVLDLETLALQEDYRLGPEAYLRLYPVLHFLGSSRTFVGASAGVSYTATIGRSDGLVRAGVESISEVQTDSGRVSDGSIQATSRIASPRWPVGRIVVDTLLLDRYANGLNRQVFLGGDTRLRGYPSEYFVGAHALEANAEYRSTPWELFRTLQLGGVLFYDAGDAFDDWKRLRLWQSVGLGARILFPQLDRFVFRIDVGFPLARPLPEGVAPLAFFVTFGQAFSLYEIAPATARSR